MCASSSAALSSSLESASSDDYCCCVVQYCVCVAVLVKRGTKSVNQQSTT